MNKRPQDRWNYGDNLNVPPHMWPGRSNREPVGYSPHSGGKGKKVFGIILGIIVVLVAIGLFA